MATQDVSFALLVEQGVAAVRERQEAIHDGLEQVKTLVQEAGRLHAAGDLAAAQETIGQAGDLLYDWLGDSDAIGPIESALRGPV